MNIRWYPFHTIRSRLYLSQVAELTPEILPPTAVVKFPNPDKLHKFYAYIRPVEGYWRGGRFEFEISVPDDYNMSPPKVCQPHRSFVVLLSSLAVSWDEKLRTIHSMVRFPDARFLSMSPDSPNVPSRQVCCKTIIWHPNIHYSTGSVCLSLLRKTAVDDGMGWTPTRSLKDIVLGLDGLFGDLVNFDDPLNVDAAQEFRFTPDLFQRKVRDHVQQYAK